MRRTATRKASQRIAAMNVSSENGWSAGLGLRKLIKPGGVGAPFREVKVRRTIFVKDAYTPRQDFVCLLVLFLAYMSLEYIYREDSGCLRLSTFEGR